MNRLAQFLHYARKVFSLKHLLRGVADHRPYPEIPASAVLTSLTLGVIIRVTSYLDLAGQTRRRGIENKAFNELTQGCGLEHCYHHQPASMLAQLQSILVCAGKQTAKALAQELNLDLEGESAWELWFCSD